MLKSFFIAEHAVPSAISSRFARAFRTRTSASSRMRRLADRKGKKGKRGSRDVRRPADVDARDALIAFLRTMMDCVTQFCLRHFSSGSGQGRFCLFISRTKNRRARARRGWHPWRPRCGYACHSCSRATMCLRCNSGNAATL